MAERISPKGNPSWVESLLSRPEWATGLGKVMVTRRTIQAGWDVLAWFVGVLAAVEIRFDFQASIDQLVAPAWLILGVSAGQLVIGFAFHVYQGRYKVGSIDEVSGITLTVTTLAVVSSLVVFITQPFNVPRSVPLLGAVIALGLMLSARVALRLYRIRRWGNGPGVRVLIYGAGEVGDHVLRLMMSDSKRTFLPVGFIDDNPGKQHLRTYGVRVLGTGAELDRIVQATGALTVVVAINNIDASMLRSLQARCASLDIGLRVVPSANALLPEAVRLGDISHVTVEDVLGRKPVHADETSIASFLRGKRVLVTGAGGSIGSELVRQIYRYQPAYLGVLDRDETGIQAVQLSIDGHGLLDSDSLILADIRDRARIEEVLSTTRPNIIFHAAALKHLPMLEMYPQEAWKTNIEGTVHLLQAAIDTGVNTFVNISTDKAADPISVLGMSKMITERLTAWAADQTGRAFVSVRFGNVLGSRGSVLNTFRTQIEGGGPVTITDPEATRFFMTISEAVHLVLQAAAIGEGGSTLILDMGDPVNIESVARQLIDMSGTNVELTYVGLRPGEKVHELLTGTNEISMPTAHPKVTQVQVTAMEPTAMENLSGRGPTEMQRLLAQPSPTLRG